MEIGPRRQALARFVERLTLRSALSGEEREALLALPATPQAVEANRDVVRLGEDVTHACLVVEGLLARYAQLADGRRQMVSLHIAGDMADLYSLMLPRAPSGLAALTASTLLKVPHEALRAASIRSPAIAAALWRDCLVDGNIIAQWLVNVGRRDARARLAHLLCEMAARTAKDGAPGPGRYAFPITQEQLADAVGLTPVHVNRTLRALREEGLVRMTRAEIHIEDWRGLAEAAEFDPAYLALPGKAAGRQAWEGV